MLRRERYGGRLGALAAGAVFLASCGKVLGVDDYEVGSDPGGPCGTFSWSATCASCMSEHCCTKTQACRADPNCAKFEMCLAGCKDDACRYGCFNDGDKPPPAGDLLSCMTIECSSACAPDLCKDVGTPLGPGCNLCLVNQDACSAIQTCLDDDACRGFRGCLLDNCSTWSNDPACRLQCATAHPEFRSAYIPIAPPYSSCQTECNLGRHWQCIGKGASAPIGTFDETTEVHLHIAAPGLPLEAFANIPVSWCLGYQGARSSCDVSGSTDTSGTAILTVPQSDGVRIGYFDWVLHPDMQIEPVAVRFYPGVNFAGPRLDLTSVPQSQPPGQAVDAGSPASAVITGSIFVMMGDCAGSVDLVSQDGPLTTLCVAPVSSPDCLATLPASYFGNKPTGDLAWFSLVPQGLYTVIGEDSDGKTVARSNAIDVAAATNTIVYLNYPLPEY